MRALRHTVTVALALFVPLASPAVRAQTAPAPQISTALAPELGKLRTLIEAANYPAALALADRLLATAAPDSFDHALLSQIKAQVLVNLARYADAIPPLEAALRAHDKLQHLPAESVAASLYLLAQLHQQAATALAEPAARRARLQQAIATFRRWESVGRATVESQTFAASLLLQLAVADPERPDPAALAEAELAARDGLLLSPTPPDTLRSYLLTVYQQRADHAASAELLELLVEKSPDNVGYWRQLVSSYLQLAAAAPHPREAERQNLRALLALERAQARGHLSAPAENYNRVALLLTLGQHETALAFLEAALADGRLENSRRNWELLANAHQQAGQADRAIDALRRATARLPRDSRLEFRLAQLFYTAGRLPEARAALERALAKHADAGSPASAHVLENPGQTHAFLAYVAFELNDHAAAARHVQAARAHPDAKPDDLNRLARALAEASTRSKL